MFSSAASYSLGSAENPWPSFGFHLGSFRSPWRPSGGPLGVSRISKISKAGYKFLDFLNGQGEGGGFVVAITNYASGPPIAELTVRIRI